jgi:hypothetical protein
MYLEGSISPIKKPQWLYCKIKNSEDLFATDPNPRGDYVISTNKN